jgi:hypothetical protein
MTNYYPKPLEAINPAIYDLNPALFVGITSRLGRFPIQVDDPWNVDYVHYSVMLKAAHMRMQDKPGWDAMPEMAAPSPGFRKAKWFYWNVEIDEKQLKSITANPNGMIAQQVRATIKAQQDYFASQVDNYLCGYLIPNATTNEDYDPEFLGLMHLKAASGTVQDPQDLCATPGTVNTGGIKVTGAGAATDPVDKAFGLQQAVFWQQYDSNLKQAMYRENNTFDVFCHPAVAQRYRTAHALTSTGDSMGLVAAMIKELSINIVPTFAVDAAYDGASGTTAEHVLTMNTTENFQIAEMVPYTVEGWKELHDIRGSVWRMRAYWKILPIAIPYYLGGVYKKAMAAFTQIPYNT